MGSPEISVPTLLRLTENFSVVGVVTQPDRVSGRGKKLTPPPVKTAALKLGLPVMQPERLKEPGAFEQLQEWAPDVIVVLAFGQILRRNVLELPPFGCVNVHASLLPRWRGASPIQSAILHGDAETGVTIMKMDPGVDTGPILCAESLPIQEKETAETLSPRLAELGAELLVRTLPLYLAGTIQPTEQPQTGVTLTHLIQKEDGALVFTESAETLERVIRAYTPWPSAYFLAGTERIKVFAAHCVPFTVVLPPGTRVVSDGLPAVAAKDGLLVFDRLQAAGKKPNGGREFLAGFRNWTD